MSHRYSRPRARSRPGRLVMVLLVWALAGATVLLTAVDTRVGPILLSLSNRHGVHLGDALVLLVATFVATGLTWLLLRRR
ncbi:MAG TPA: hypothetical protein VNO83_06460 [Pseudonocardia sp.]|nr:hypothetical protein [Pseudonocardia sp.]